MSQVMTKVKLVTTLLLVCTILALTQKCQLKKKLKFQQIKLMKKKLNQKQVYAKTQQ